MELLPVRAIQSPWESDDFLQKRKRFLLEEFGSRKKKKNESKILDLVLERISDPQFNSHSSLLVTATTPQVEFAGLSDPPIHKQPKKIIKLLKDAQRSLASLPKRQDFSRPLGINRCEYNNWINALMQFIIFIPSLSEMFAYTPKSLSPFIEFIDQYRKDQALNKAVTHANSVRLLESFRKKFQIGVFVKTNPSQLFYEILKLLMNSVHWGQEVGHGIDEIDLLALHPDWSVALDADSTENVSWEEKVERHFKQSGFFDKADLDLFLPFPKELLVSFKNFSFKSYDKVVGSSLERLIPKRQFFLSYLGTPCALYELNAFIEYRPDGTEKGDYMTYLKVEGDWLQCDDTRIMLLRPSNLSIPMRRSFLFYYKKVK